MIKKKDDYINRFIRNHSNSNTKTLSMFLLPKDGIIQAEAFKKEESFKNAIR